MIKRNEETGKENKNIVSSFKKFSEISDSKVKEYDEDPSSGILPAGDERPGNPNLPSNKSKVEKPMSTNYMMPNPKNRKSNIVEDEDIEDEDMEDDINEKSDVKFYGKVAKLPKGTKASKGYNFLENVKVSKSSIWYIMVEKCDNELQMVKYNHKKGVDLAKFINELKSYYISKCSPKFSEAISNIAIDGNDKYSMIKGIPLIEVEGKKMITKITEDLIKLLSK